MIEATNNDTSLIINILTASFIDNQSVNYVIREGKKKNDRIHALMNYSLEVCRKSGDVFLSEDRKACALIIYPDRKKTTFRSVLLDLELIFKCIGIQNVKKTLKREALIKRVQPKVKMTYLWFIGVVPEWQQNGIGSRMLAEIIENSRRQNRPVYLETSTLTNLPWYKKFGFKIYHEEDIGYKLYFLNNKSD